MLDTEPYDLCIVGAGVAGALIAAVAARRGKRVVIIEAGRRFRFENRLDQLRRYEILGEPDWPWVRQDRDDYVDSSEDSIGYSYKLNTARVKAVGGTTLHWGGMVHRFRESDFRTASLYGLGIDWPISYRELEPYYCLAEWELGVSGTPNPTDPPRSEPYPMPGFPAKYGEAIWEPVAERLGISLDLVAQARNSQPFAGRSACVAYAVCNLCPSGAKYSADFHVGEAEKSGLCQVLAETVARRIDTDSSGRVTAVHASALDGKEYEIRATDYVIAAHAVETARLLLLSGVGNHSGQVGRNLMEHWYVAASGYHESQSFPERIGFSTLCSSSFYDGRDRTGRGAIKLEFGTSTDPAQQILHSGRWGTDFADYACREFGHRLRVAAETEQQPNPNSYIGLDPVVTDKFGDPVPHVHFELSDVDRKTQEQSQEILETLLIEVGAKEIAHSKAYGPRHHMGTCRMSDDPDSGVVNRDCRVHSADNLYIAGSSVFPTGGAMQPTLTIAALALRLADHITKDSQQN